MGRDREALDRSLTGWRKAQEIRAYVGALEAKIESNIVTPDDPSVFERWLESAHWYADFLCPITPTPPPPASLAAPQPANTPVSELDLTSGTRTSLERSTIMVTDGLYELGPNELGERCGEYYCSFYSEVTRVLEGLGYDVSKRRPYW